MSKLLLFTEHFPGKGETFIDTELTYLAHTFDKIIIFPLFENESVHRILPENCIVMPPVTRNNFSIIIKGVFSKAPLCFFIKNFFSEKVFRKFRKFRKFVIISCLTRCILSHKNFKIIQQLSTEKNNILYFYWGAGYAYILPFIQTINKKVVRFHRADLYTERQKGNYLPFRKEIYTHLNQAVFISQHGYEYAKRRYSEWKFNSTISYLGTPDHGIVSSKKDKKQCIHIVSCSNVIPIKRVTLIAEALKLLPATLHVSWTHLGDGPGFEELKRICDQLPEHIQVHLKGYMPHSEIATFYKNTEIDLFINVSSSEGLPVSLMEAISFNIPVIATNVGGSNEIVTPESGILLPEKFELSELSKDIIYIYQNYTQFQPRQLWLKKFYADKNYPQFIKEILLS
ncbi:MAG: glycosyltransferase [Odoribacter sp.]